MATPHLLRHHINPGDVFTLCKGILDICKTDELSHAATGNAGAKDMKTLVAEMEVMRGHLAAVPCSRSLKDGDGHLNPLVTRSLRPIERDLVDLHLFLEEHRERKKSVHVLEQARYAMVYQSRLRAWREEMERHRESVCVVGEVLAEKGVEEGKRRQSILKLEGLVEREERRRESREFLGGGGIEEGLEEGLDGGVGEREKPVFRSNVFGKIEGR